MGATRPPFMYQPVKKDDDRFPAAPFDPKAVTRASYEAKKPKPRPDGPLVSFNRHPDAHMVPSGRSRYKPLGRRTKGWIKGMRVFQLCLRIVEVIAAVGLIVTISLAGMIGWVMGVTLGLVTIHCLYSVYHHARPAGGRTPGSSAAYHVFSAVSDLCVLPLYAYGVITTRTKSDEWQGTDKAATNEYRVMLPAVYYGLMGAGGLHLLSLAISLWLGVMFRRISTMPPDMNPLEANLTSRGHKRNKSSVATASTYSDGEKPATSQLYGNDSRPPSIPFMHTRQGSDASFSTRDSRLDLPSRQYQVAPGNRSSAGSQDFKRVSAPPAPHRTSYTEIPLGETGGSPSRPASMYSAREGRPGSGSAAPATTHPRPARFTETWYASDSLISRTQQRTRAMNRGHSGGGAGAGAGASHTRGPAAYESLRQTLDASDSSDNDSDVENNYYHTSASKPPAPPSHNHHLLHLHQHQHPNPLRSNPPPTATDATTTTTTATTAAATTNSPASPATASPSPRRPRTPFSRLRASVLSQISPSEHNRRRQLAASQDITDASPSASPPSPAAWPWAPRNRDSSIQPDAAFSLAGSGPGSGGDGDGDGSGDCSYHEYEFYAKPYGELRAGTPPVMVGGGGGGGGGIGGGRLLGERAAAAATSGGGGGGGGGNGGGRVVSLSSGNDYDMGSGAGVLGRRNVSGKVVEEGRASGWR